MNFDGKTLTINTEAPQKSFDKGKILTIFKDSYFTLKEKSNEFDFSNPQLDSMELAMSLLKTMEQYQGLGLAAPQCGIQLRVFALRDGTVMFNPKILETSNEEDYIRMKEGCLSFPGLLIPVTRPNKVLVRWQNVDGIVHEAQFSGLSARVILHEYDHLEGILFTEKVGNITLQMAKKKLQKLKKKIERKYR